MRYLLRFGLLGSLTFLSFFIYFYKSSGKFRNSIIAAFAAVSVFLAGLTPAHGAGEVDAFMPKPNPQRGLNPRPGLFSGRSTTNNHGSGPEKPDDFGSDGLPEFPQTESVERTKERNEWLDYYLRQLSEESNSDSDTDTDDQIDDQIEDQTDDQTDDECRARGSDTNSAHYSEPVTFCDGYKAQSVNSSADHQIVKHGHHWEINDIDKDADKPSGLEQFEQVRTKTSTANRKQFRNNLRKFASRPDLEIYSNYPINGGMGRAYLDPSTDLFMGIDENDIIRKTYPASEGLINFLRTKCKREDSGN